MKALIGLLGSMVLLTGCVQHLGGQEPSFSATTLERAEDIASADIVRIVTPFAEPRVVTTSQAEIQRNQNVLYILPEQDEPISMFVTDGKSEVNALSLTLRPTDGGKRELNFATALPRDAEVRKASAPGIRLSPRVATDDNRNTRPCRLCRDQDDEGEGYSGDRW